MSNLMGKLQTKLFDPKDIPSELIACFDEVETICGAPWTRVTKKGFTDHSGETKSTYPEGTTAKRLAKLRQAARGEGKEYQNTSETVGWQPTCKCNADKVPSIVLDPFAGAGTTLCVAKKLNRKAWGYEISEEYCRLTVDRCLQQVLL